MYSIEGEGSGKLQKFLTKAEKLAVVTVGHPLRKDDGVGLTLGRMLEKVMDNIFITEQAPENYIYTLIQKKFTHILIIDAAEMELPPGKAAILQRQELLEGKIMTHSVPIHFFTRLMETLDIKVLILGIQPKDRGFGQEVSSSVRKGAENLADRIIREIETKSNDK